MTDTLFSTFTREEVQSKYWTIVQQNIQRFGNKTFIVTEKGSLSYAEVNQHANTIFACLKETEHGCWIGGGPLHE